MIAEKNLIWREKEKKEKSSFVKVSDKIKPFH